MSTTHYVRHCDAPGCAATVEIPWRSFQGIDPWSITELALLMLQDRGWSYTGSFRCPEHNETEPEVHNAPDSAH